MNEVVQLRIRSDEVLPFLGDVQRNADLNRNALGFLPPAAYEDAAGRGHLFVATVCVDDAETYVGHLLFGGVFPHARIFQVNVTPSWRSKGIAKALVTTLVRQCEEHQFLTISAKVADDLEANAFWERAGFRTVRSYTGGGVRNRMLNHRVRELDSPCLFAPGVSSRTTRLRFADKVASHHPVFVIDLNVVWDVLRHRSRYENATQVIKAAFNQSLAVMIAEEFISELQRTSRGPGVVDPVLDFALALPTLKKPPDEDIERLTSVISARVFPDRTRSARLTTQDKSDLVHLATAIHHGAYGFVTNEKAITDQSRFFFDEFSIRVMDVSEFAQLAELGSIETHGVAAAVSGGTIKLWDLLDGNLDLIQQFLKDNKADPGAKAEFCGGSTSLRDRRRVLVTSDLDIVCLASWDSAAALKPVTTLRIVADEEHPAIEAVLSYLLGRVCKSVSEAHPVHIQLTAMKSQAVLLKIALMHGFEPGDDGDRVLLRKLAIASVISAENWPEIRDLIRLKVGLIFGEKLPSYESLSQELGYVTSDGETANLTLAEFESLFSPTLLALEGREGAIVPIRECFSEHLLGNSPQMSLLPRPEASLLSERLYFSSPRNAKLLTPGTPILFYESAKDGGRGAVIAMARVIGSSSVAKLEIPDSLLRQGVLGRDAIANINDEERVLVTRFDTVMELSAVPYRWLTDNGCNSGANFVCPQRISHVQLLKIIAQANEGSADAF